MTPRAAPILALALALAPAAGAAEPPKTPAPAAATAAPGAPASATAATAPGAVLQEVVGTVSAVDRERHRVSIATPGGSVELALDRNTLVYLPGGLGTVLDVTPGATVRAGRDGDFHAYWVAVRAATAPRGPAASGTGGPPPAEAGAGALPSAPAGGPPLSPGGVGVGRP